MGLSSFFQRFGRSSSAEAGPSRAEGDAVSLARTRARRRLIGAVVLLLIGVIGFPLLFETQPRPVAVNVPIVIPSRDGGAAPVLSTAPGAATGAQAPGTAQVERTDSAPAADAADGQAAAERAAQDAADQASDRAAAEKAAAVRAAASEQAATAQAVADQAAAEKVAADRAAAEKAAADKAAADKAAADKLAAQKTAADKAAADKAAADKAAQAKADAAKSAAAAEAARARALLEGREVPKAVRVVVQVGAYADNQQVLKVRQRLEGMGYKTYTQTVTVRGQRTTRVRVGPFDDRAKADEVATRVKAAGLPAAVLVL